MDTIIVEPREAAHQLRNFATVAYSHMPPVDELGSAIHAVERFNKGLLTGSGKNPVEHFHDVEETMSEWFSYAASVLDGIRRLREKGVV